ncbi:MAG: OmpA family protein [Fibrobacteraceae bacterium]|nr:OmpA family protein [Fibrobacteraceae bacterium]
MKEREAHANAKQDSLMRASKEREAILLAEASAREDSLRRASKERESELEKALAEERAKAEARQKEAKSKLNELQSKLIQVTQDARGIILSMSDILFDVDKATLKQDLKTSLAKVAGILSVYQELNVVVEGHTDNTGSEKHNMKLSEQRAKNVLDFLVSQGIESSRLTSVGYGMTRPVGDNKTKEGRQKNRRVDLVIQDKVLQGK